MAHWKFNIILLTLVHYVKLSNTENGLSNSYNETLECEEYQCTSFNKQGKCLQITCNLQTNQSNDIPFINEMGSISKNTTHTDKFIAPKCINVTITKEQFKQLSVEVRQHLKTNYRYNTSSNLTNICYETSESFRHCNNSYKKIYWNDFIFIPDNITIFHLASKNYYEMGDYYIDPSKEVATVCPHYEEPCLKRHKSPSRFCNFIFLTNSEYHLNTEGSMTLPWRNETILYPQYEKLDDPPGSLNVCYPLTSKYKNCGKSLLPMKDCELLDGRRVYSISHDKIFDLNEYVPVPMLGYVICNIPGTPLADAKFILGILNLIVAFCLLLAFIIHFTVPGINYNAKPLLLHIFTLMLMYVGLAATKLATSPSPRICYALFIFTYFFSISAFCWLSILAFDLWRQIRKMKIRLGFSILCDWNWCSCFYQRWVWRRRHRFAMYCFYAFGLPVFLTALVVIIDFNSRFKNFFRIEIFDSESCWFKQCVAEVALFLVPIGVILLTNATLFVCTVHNIWQSSRGISYINKHIHRELFLVSLKLFVVMGVFWVIQIVTWESGYRDSSWNIPDIICAVFIFIAYICKPATLRKLQDKLRDSPELTPTLRSRNGTPANSQVDLNAPRYVHRADAA